MQATKGAQVLGATTLLATGIVWFIHYNQSAERQVGSMLCSWMAPRACMRCMPPALLMGARLRHAPSWECVQAMKEGPKRDVERYRAKLQALHSSDKPPQPQQ